MATVGPGRAACWRWVIALVLLAAAAHAGRRAFIGAFFRDGAPRAGAPLPGAEEDAALPRAPRLRVVLIDGLSAARARTLPALSRLCARGQELVVDAGFPTVSLPVQHVLWTGRTQQTTGVEYRIAPLAEPPADSLPARVPGSRAVAESHLGIAGSFGFGQVLPGPRDPVPAGWRPDGFEAAAVEAVASAAPLVFVHVLRVDEAGHAEGAASRAYAEAAAAADALLDRLLRADAARSGPPSAWVLVADHGHLPGGGHGGAEPQIRLVRGCLRGPGLSPGAAAAEVHMVDLARILREWAGIDPGPRREGRTLAAARLHPAPGATLPWPGAPRLALAALLAGLGLLLGFAAAGRRPWLWPWWIFLSHVGVLAVFGTPTLSMPAVYPPLGRDLLLAAAPGWALAGVQAAVAGRGLDARRVSLALMLPALGVVAGTFALCGGRPPLVPLATAACSEWLVIAAAGALAVAAGLALACVWRRPRG